MNFAKAETENAIETGVENLFNYLNMKKLLTIISALLLAVTAKAQTGVEAAFYSAPDDVITYAPKTLRMDMVDYFKSGSSRLVQNAFFDGSRILELTDESITIQETADSASIAQIFVEAKAKNDSIIILIRNIATPAIDGRITFYDSKWNEITGCFKEPTLKEWLISNKKEDVALAERLIPFVMAKYIYNAENKILTLTPSFDAYMPEDDYNKVAHLIRPEICFRLTGSKMKKCQ